jgi:hypothetical protein
MDTYYSFWMDNIFTFGWINYYKMDTYYSFLDVLLQNALLLLQIQTL